MHPHNGYPDESDDGEPNHGFMRSSVTDVAEKRVYGAVRHRIDVGRSRFPFCIVWTPLPMITWFLPFIGHMGIADSRGVIYDFAGPYTIGSDDFAFGRPTRVLQLDPEVAGADLRLRDGTVVRGAEAWDAGIDAGNAVYCKRMHNICCDNCHSHVARALNEMRYMGRTDWNMVNLAAWLFFRGKYVSFARAVATWLPFLLLVAAVLLLKLLL